MQRRLRSSADVVRWDRGGHADRDALRAVGEPVKNRGVLRVWIVREREQPLVHNLAAAAMLLRKSTVRSLVAEEGTGPRTRNL